MQIKEILKKFDFIVNIYENYYKMLSKIPVGKRYRSICNGKKNKGKKFFLITSMLTGSQCGLYSTILCIGLPYIDFAIKKGWIPVIDLREVRMPMLQDEDKFGIENPWEYYYKQPMDDVPVEEVYQSKCVRYAYYWGKKVKVLDWSIMFPPDEKTLKYWNNIITSYIRLNDALEDRIAVERNRIFGANRKVMGVGVRAGLGAGAMRNEKLYNGHPKQPTCEELMEIVEEKMKSWGYEYIFLSCDDREYFNKFVSRWGEKCCYVERSRLHFFENDEPVWENEKRNIEFENVTMREKNEEYIIETYLLAECNSGYLCRGGGTVFAYLLNNGKYEHVEIYDEGLYENLEKE
ncbi:MAG: hypothetical protein NC321_03335 [Clostridium sp.]|nr:hypothetical protein [Clostridium sp.]